MSRLIIGVVVGVILFVALIAGIVVGVLMGGVSEAGITVLPSNNIVVNMETDLKEYKNPLNILLKKYKDAAKNANAYTQCKSDKPKESDKNCLFDMMWLETPCRMEDDWGYTQNQTRPCIILIPNKVEAWTPTPYESFSALPKDMPQDLKDKIQVHSYDIHGDGETIDKTVWVSCEGETDEDTKNMGTVVTSPWYGFPVYYFPYQTFPSYQQPLLGLYFRGLASGVEVNVKCRIWEKNTDPNKNPLRFTIKVD